MLPRIDAVLGLGASGFSGSVSQSSAAIHGHLHSIVSRAWKKYEILFMKCVFFSFQCVCVFCYCVGRKPHMNIGTIGHVDHGKTTLTAAITKVRFRNRKRSSPFFCWLFPFWDCVKCVLCACTVFRLSIIPTTRARLKCSLIYWWWSSSSVYLWNTI